MAPLPWVETSLMGSWPHQALPSAVPFSPLAGRCERYLAIPRALVSAEMPVPANFL